MLFTVQQARDNIRNREGKRVFYLGKGDSLTSEARDYLTRERIDILPAEKARPEEYALLGGGFCREKPEDMTHLNGHILVKKSPLRAIELTEKDVPDMIDELPLIALLCAFADGESVMRGAKELRVKESDRIQTTAALITALGGECTPIEDGFLIRGRKLLRGGAVDSFLDHRIAMTAAVGLIASEKGGCIKHPECCAISFPDFFEKLDIKGV
jgi:3-phosphoshikimate 1-carboxyvinyltransferase